MVLDFEKNLSEALKEIDFIDNHQEIVIHDKEEQRELFSSCGLIEKYGRAKWQVVDLVNEQFSAVLKDKFDLYNWLNHREEDELAYFLNEAGSNCLNYAEFKVPWRMHLWLGKKGFVVGMEQKGHGFNASAVDEKRLKENEGAAFEFFRNCRSQIFFDDAREARMVLMEWLLK